VIIDLGLPGMDGYEVAQALRASAGGKPLHLAALTGREDPRDRQHSREVGFDQHVVKPVDAEMLKAIVRTAEQAGIAPTQA
jgi:two-component system CheB/CheR fusion protein